MAFLCQFFCAGGRDKGELKYFPLSGKDNGNKKNKKINKKHSEKIEIKS